VVAVACYVVIRRLVRSQAGRAMIALRENEALASSVGIDVTRYLVLATVTSAAMAGAAGALYTHYVRIVDPDIFLFIYTVTMVIMVVTGGKGTLAGPIVGGVIFGMLPEVLRSFAIVPELQWVLFGILMILIVFLLPQGIVPAVVALFARHGQPPRATRAAGRGRAGSTAMTAALTVERLSIRFGGLTAVEDATFEVREGEVLSLIGPNGAGKTSLFNAITGYLRAASGDVSFRGRRLTGLKPHAIAALGVVRTFQKTSLFGGESALDNVLIGLHLRSHQRPIAIVLGLPSVARDEREQRAAAWDILRFMAIEARAGETAASLPYGEQRLLEVAIALAARPTLLLLDEPVSGMNPAEKARFMGTLAKIRARGITVLLVEHDMRTVMGVSDRVICLSQGRIIADGSPQEIQAHPEVIRAYLGERAVRAQG
jgi:branched-chain amino acid transport system ATP-binding protein